MERPHDPNFWRRGGRRSASIPPTDTAPQKFPELDFTAQRIAEEAEKLWKAKWALSHGTLKSSLLMGVVGKPVNRRVWLLGLAACDGIALAWPKRAGFSADIVARENIPVAVVVTADASKRTARVPVTLGERTLTIGDFPAVNLAAPGAPRVALHTYAAAISAAADIVATADREARANV